MDIQILDSMLANYEAVFVGGISKLNGDAIGLLWILIGIDFSLSILLNLQDMDHMKNLITKIFKYGFWVWVVTEYQNLVDIIINSLTQVGFSVGSGISQEILKHPSQICEQGIKISRPYLEFLNTQSNFELFFSNLGTNFLALFAIMAICLAFVILAIQVCVTYIEFYLSATLLFIFIPFGANKHMSFLAEKAIGAIFSYGVKLMVLGAILGVSTTIINGWSVEIATTPDFKVIVATVAACWLITFLAWQAPGIAAGLMAGAPSLSAGTVAGMGVAGAAAVVGGGMAMSGAAGAAASIGSSAVRAGASVAGAAVAGGSNADENTSPLMGAMKGVANMAGNSVMGTAAGFKNAVAGAYQKGAANSVAPGSASPESPTPAAPSNPPGGGGGTGGAAFASAAGGSDGAGGARTAENAPSRATGTATSQSGPGGASGGPTSYANSIPGIMGAAASDGNGKTPQASQSSFMGNIALASQTAQKAVPPETAPQGGISVPIRHDD